MFSRTLFIGSPPNILQWRRRVHSLSLLFQCNLCPGKGERSRALESGKEPGLADIERALKKTG